MSIASNPEMRAFVQVVQRGSFAAAARALGLTPSAVSKLVSRLEGRLGVRLLHRTTRRLALTSEGDLYFSRARQILADIEEVETEVAGLRAAPRGSLHVNTSSGFAVHQLVPVLREFMPRYPEIQLELTVTDRVVDLVSEHADVTIRTGPVAEPSLTALRIAAYGRTICASPSYLRRCGTPRVPADLPNHACIVFSVPTARRWPFKRGDEVADVEITPSVITDSSDTVLQLALDGVGIVRLGDIMVGTLIRQGRLVPLLTDVHHAGSVPISALYLAGRHRLPKVRVFLDFLVERFADPPWRNTADVGPP